MFLSALRSFIVIMAMACLSLAIAMPASALTEVPLTEIDYKPCPADLAEGNVGSGSSNPASCFLVTGVANNRTGKTVYDADVFGRIYDANHEPAMQNRTRLGNITEIPPGKSNFEVRINVPAQQPLPLQLEQFKASGFSAKIRGQAL
ncbi:hypothetical protein IQ225_10570 [Synechocystis salina LEGE 06155]|nr:hypothetical protein [Synechocystis salina LEGE 06155]